MNQILTTAIKPAIAMIALVGSLVVADAAQAGHYGQRPCNPAAEAHMKTAIRLMTIACNKPIHVSKSLARAAVTHISLAQRFTRNPGAQAELYGAKATLGQFIYSHCAPPFHPAIQQTRLALDLERSPCVCGRAACRGGCQAPPPVHPGFGDGFHAPSGPGFNGGIGSPIGPDDRDGRFQPPRPEFNGGIGSPTGPDDRDGRFQPPRPEFNGGIGSPTGPGYRNDRFQPPRPEFNGGRGDSFERGSQGRDFEGSGFVQPRGAWNRGLTSLASRWGQLRFGN